MTQAQLEQIYASLARKVDQIGPECSELFLAKLALSMAHEWGDVDGVERCIVDAARSLEAE